MYSVTFELAGFRTAVYPSIRTAIGFRTQVNGALEISSVVESITIFDPVPLVDRQETGTKANFDLEQLQNIPSARDPWAAERRPASR